MAINIKTSVKVTPKCYAYITPEVPKHNGWTKIGYTEREVEKRIKEQTHTANITAKICWQLRSAFITEPYENFTDKDFHAYLKKMNIEREKGTEWFYINPETAKGHFIDFTQNHGMADGGEEKEAIPYKLRAEQEKAVKMTADFFNGKDNVEFLWNAKPRFGKTLSAYDLCLKLSAKNILIVTNRPAIANSWYADYERFFGRESGYIFVSNVEGIKDKKYVYSREEYLKKLDDDENIKGCIEFVSLQDLKGSIYFGGRYDKLSELSRDKGLKWDIMIVDEAHEGVDTYKTDWAFAEINRKYTLHLSGTPFKALANDKFPANAIYNWTYADEQKNKRDWDNSLEDENPYINLPKLTLYTYKMSDIVKDKVRKGVALAENDAEEYAFDLNEFFRTNESGNFIHNDAVDKLLDAMTKGEKFPFSTPKLRDELKHTFWLLERVASAKALAKKLKLHPVFGEYEIILAAGDGKLDEDEENEKSFDKVQKAIEERDKTITLSVGQLTTGVTIPEWTAVLMLSNMSSPALYMQAAFRAQNPCLFTDNDGNTFRKENAYVFDFDPARTLTIFEKFANDLIPENTSDNTNFDNRKNNVKELLNFFPVYAENEVGEMTELNAEEVLTIPRRIYAREVVDRGFMSNFLFSNIGGIFSAPKEIIELINNMQAIEEPKKLSPADIDENTKAELNLNENGEVEIPEKVIIGDAAEIFGDKIYKKTEAEIAKIAENAAKTNEKDLTRLQKNFAEPMTAILLNTAKEQYGKDLKKSTQNNLERQIKNTTAALVNTEYGKFAVRDNKLQKEQEDKIKKAQDAGKSLKDIEKIDKEYDERRKKAHQDMMESIQEKLKDKEIWNKTTQKIVETVETEKSKTQKETIEGNVRDHLRGFSRTIPAFLMAYGDESTALQNFDKIADPDIFFEVTKNPQNGKGVTVEDFRELRDKYHLFDETVFNDAVKDFNERRKRLANYFDADKSGEDIFDYIPPQRTNQIFTPKKVVKDMINRLEKENPGCFDNPKAKFADLYIKSGMYITEIVTRLYQSEKMKKIYPKDEERLNHIFAEQVYGAAPTEIIYRISTRYILGFSDKIKIKKHNIKFCDTLKFAKNGTMEENIKKLFEI